MSDTSNPYDALVQQDTAGNLRVSMMNAVDKQPDVEAKLQNLAKQYNMPVDAVRLRQPEIERKAKLDALDYDTLARSNPITANHLSDPQNAALAHDDVDNMGLLETLVNSFKRGVPALKSFAPSLQMVNQSAGLQQLDFVDRELAAGRTPDQSQLGVMASQYLAAPADRRASMRAQITPPMRSAVADSITQYLDLQRQRSAIPLPGVVDKAMGAKTWGDAFSAVGAHPLQFIAGIVPESLVQSGPGLLAAIPAGIAAGPAGAGAAMGANSFLTDYAASITDMMQSAGVDISNPEAIKAALADPKILAKVTSNAAKHAGVVGLVDAISGGIAGKMVLPTGKLAGRPLAQELANIAMQAPIRGVLGAAGEAGGELAAGQDLKPGEILAEAFGEFFGTPGEVVSASAKRVVHIRQQAQQADAHAKVLTELTTLAEASKVRERDPAAFATFAQSLTEEGVPNLFVDANALMQSGVDINALALALPSVAEQIEQAHVTGGDLVIPTGEFLTAGPGNEFMQSLIDHARTSEGAMSPAQGRQYMQEHGDQLEADIAQVLGEKLGDRDWQASRDALRDEFKAQLGAAKRFTSDVNGQYANLLANFYSVTAAKLGISPQDLVQRYGLQVSARETPGGRKLAQGPGLEDLRQQWADAGVDGTISEGRDGIIELSKIVVPETDRGAGKGTAAMQALIDYADRTGQHVVLSPSADFGGNKAKLVKFYKRFGFVENKGKNRAFTTRETMYRQAPGKVLHQFAGTNAKTADVHALATAQARLTQGDDAETVRRETGWHEGADGKWRFEISDHDAKLLPALKSLKDGGYEARPVKSITYRETGPGRWDVTLNPTDPQSVSDFVVLQDVDKDVLRAVLPDTVLHSIEQGRGFEDMIGDLEPAKGLGFSFEFEGLNALPLDKVLDHPRLFEAYPQLAQVLVQVDPKLGIGGAFALMENGQQVIRIGKGEQLSTVLHEVQHGIQSIEGFAAGGSPTGNQARYTEQVNGELRILLETDQDLAEAFDKWAGFQTAMSNGDPFDAAAAEQAETALQSLPDGDKAIDLWSTLDGLSDPDSAARVMQDRYLRLAGEVEARNTQSRAGLAEWDRQHTRVDATADTPSSRVIVVFDGKEMLNAPAPANATPAPPPRGEISLPDDLTSAPAVISLFKDANLSTFVHESGHFFLEVQMDLAARIQGQITDGASVTDGERTIVGDANAILNWFGIKGAEGVSALTEWHTLDLEAKRPLHEQWARGFEAYAFEGNSPSVELQGMFQKFRAWMLAVYKELKALNVSLTDEVRGVMDRMLASTQAIQEAEAARRMGPLFATAEQAGMSLDDFKQYHDLATSATQTAIDDLQARGLRDMKWLTNAKSRKLKELQKQADSLRRGVHSEVRAEVMSQPIYRAWQFLTGKGDALDTAQPDAKSKGDPKTLDLANDSLLTAIAKLGGLSREAAATQWGVDTKEKLQSGVFGMPVLRKDGGLSIDAMGERLLEAGYLLPDEHGKHDNAELEELFNDELRGTPRYSHWHEYSREGEAPTQTLPEHVAFGKLDTAVLKHQYGEKADATWRKLSGLHMTSEANGIHPDIVAEAFGFSSGDELVQALNKAEPPKSVIEGMTDQRMLERHGDLGTPEGVQRAVDKAIHSEARARFVASEIKALETGNKVKGVGPSGRSTVDLLAQAARQQAERIISALRVRDIRPGQYVAAEARAARAAEIAMRAGKTAEVLAEKRHQIINLQAAKTAYAAQDEVQRTADYLAKFGKAQPSIDVEYMDQIRALLDRFEFAKGVSLKSLDKRKTLAEWVQSQIDQGMEPEIPPELMNEANRKSYKDMTVEELRGLRDTVKQIEHLGRLKNRLLTSKATRDFTAVRDEISDSITLHAGDRTADTRTPTTKWGKSMKALRDFGAAHIKAATWARVFDGGHDGGPMWEYVIRTANDRADMETGMRAKATEQLHTILKPVLDAGKMDGKGVFFPTIKRSMNREGVIAMALNMGNAGNMQRMLGGEGWSVQQVAPVLQTLTAQEWHAVQAIWDHFESYRPQIGAKERRVYGKEPAWVEPVPFAMTTPDGQTVSLRGGYYPVKYDPLASSRAEQHNDAEAAKRQLQGAYTSATTRRGFTKARVEEVNGRPLLYSLAGVYSGVNDVIHDLAWHEWLIDANKILRSDKIDRAIREHYGPEAVRQFKTWVAGVAAGEQGLQAELDGALGRIRHGVSIAGLGFNVMSAAMQPLGITQSIVRVGAKWVGKGLAQYIAAPIAKTKEVNNKSEFMAGRSRTRFRELNELRNQVEGEHAVRSAVSTGAYFLMMRCQQMVDTPTWLGAYEKAISEGNAEDRAIALADQAVTDAQGGGQTKDLSAIERGGPPQKLFTVFYSFMNTALNVGVGQTMSANTPAKRGKLVADYLMLYTVPVILGAALKDALTPGDSGDWESWDKAMRKLAGEQLGFLFGLMVVTREFSEAGKIAAGLSDRPFGYSGPAGTRLISDSFGFVTQVNQGEFDDSFRKASVNLLGDLFALPAVQINRTVTGAEALADGKTENPTALVFGFQHH